MTDILLINPPRQKNGEQSLFNNALLWLASYLVNQGYKVRVLHLSGPDFLNDLKKNLENYQPVFCAISCKWWDTLFPAIYLADFIRKAFPEIKLITGGNTASSFAGEIIEHSCFDYVICGDAELPLKQILQGQVPENSFTRENNLVTKTSHSYIQDNLTVNDIFLVPGLDRLVNPVSAINKYVWTGKGCTSNCFFCAAGRDGQSKLYGRKGYLYRDINRVLEDCRIIGSFTNNRLMFDFDPMDKEKTVYYENLLSAMPKKQYMCDQFYFWYLPPLNLVSLVAGVFTTAYVGIDLQVFSEPLRKKLSKERIIKPKFYSNQELEEVLTYCTQFPNLRITLSGLLGMPFETKEDISNTYQFFRYFLKKYPQIVNIGINPVIVEPDSPLLIHSEKYNVLPLRRSFADFYELTEFSFNTNLFSRPLANYYEYLKYFGLIRKGYDEAGLFNEFKEISRVLGSLIKEGKRGG